MKIRRSIYINHNNHKELGFLNHKKTLDILINLKLQLYHQDGKNHLVEQLRSISSGCATIISNRGGLIETTDHAVILKKIDELILYKELKN